MKENIATRNSSPSQSECGSSDLIQRSSDMSEDSFSALHLAVLDGDIDIVKALCQEGFDPNCKSQNHVTALHIASQNNNHDIIDFLVKNGADINSQDFQGWTPLHCASYNGNVEAGADVNHKNIYDKNPIEMACSPVSFLKTPKDRVETLKILVGEKNLNQEMIAKMNIDEDVKKELERCLELKAPEFSSSNLASNLTSNSASNPSSSPVTIGSRVLLPPPNRGIY